ncbi:MAG TPA: hypothetical protein VFF69_13835 [Phycisphaerales bacterium]|nr:hypothetical protein [Phycisphaerales bacterium]
MRTERTFALITTTLGLLAPVALAQDYGDGRADGDAIRDSSEATVRLVGFAGGAWRTLNSDGHTSIPVSSFANQQFYTIGQVEVDSGATDTVEAGWWEIALPTERFVQVVFRSENGGQFVPFNAKLNGQTVQAYTYEMGGDGDGIDFLPWVTSVLWDELTVSYSSDGGQTVYSDPTIHDPIGASAWDGTDSEHLGLAFPGDGVNWMQVTYKFEAIPAPASAVALLVPGGLLLRRRR